ncbi:hypothetical protein SESBI_26536 [Sesbania bispinosa]|nr:hypothetical protein SESBI_26536 [Sesbania bispinosa]
MAKGDAATAASGLARATEERGGWRWWDGDCTTGGERKLRRREEKGSIVVVVVSGGRRLPGCEKGKDSGGIWVRNRGE